eukprot:TRINITY_DN4737_c0_g1_i1.p1 TRINITY_DN4737_c0_g1~~TRINITY_DN4737_c0_g1_i1.p1  ORF type:complete len:337 (-),score=61.51 TRINITY_DN4737_c0_g1_i1:26-1036(-)
MCIRDRVSTQSTGAIQLMMNLLRTSRTNIFLSKDFKNLSVFFSRFSTGEGLKVPIEMIKQLREKTKSGMQDCRNALLETNLDIAKAEVWLEKKAVESAKKKKDRHAAEGLVCALISPNKKKGTIIELNTETDFCAKSPVFQSLVRELAILTLNLSDPSPSVETILSSVLPSTHQTVHDTIQHNIGILRENVILRRVSSLSGDLVSSYSHGNLAGSPLVGKRAGLISIETSKPEALGEFAQQLAAHVVAMEPKYITPEEVPSELRSNEDEIGAVLLDQEFGISGEDLTVGQAIRKKQDEIGASIGIRGFFRFKVGETTPVLGKRSFAEEVNSLIFAK